MGISFGVGVILYKAKMVVVVCLAENGDALYPHNWATHKDKFVLFHGKYTLASNYKYVYFGNMDHSAENKYADRQIEDPVAAGAG